VVYIFHFFKKMSKLYIYKTNSVIGLYKEEEPKEKVEIVKVKTLIECPIPKCMGSSECKSPSWSIYCNWECVTIKNGSFVVFNRLIKDIMSYTKSYLEHDLKHDLEKKPTYSTSNLFLAFGYGFLAFALCMIFGIILLDLTSPTFRRKWDTRQSTAFIHGLRIDQFMNYQDVLCEKGTGIQRGETQTKCHKLPMWLIYTSSWFTIDRATKLWESFSLRMQKDGNLVMYQGTEPVWASNTMNKDCTYATIYADEKDEYLKLHCRDQDYVYSRRKRQEELSGKEMTGPIVHPGVIGPPGIPIDNTMHCSSFSSSLQNENEKEKEKKEKNHELDTYLFEKNASELKMGMRMTSLSTSSQLCDYGCIYLTPHGQLQTTGDKNNWVLEMAGVLPHGEYTLRFQRDGNLVLYDAKNEAKWASDTFETPWRKCTHLKKHGKMLTIECTPHKETVQLVMQKKKN
jgi:hypothetical protein